MSIDPALLFIITFLLLLAGVGSPLALSLWPRLSHKLSYGIASLASLVGLSASGMLLIRNQTLTFDAVPLTPLTTVTLRIDPLANLFLLVIFLVGLAVSIYARGFAKIYVGKKHVGALGSMFNLFLLAMTLVLTADHGLVFLFSWELMALISFFLVAYEHEDVATQQASILYAVMTQIGTGFLFIAFFILASHAHGFSFADFRLSAGTLPEWQRHLIFLGALIGFGTKVGIVPMHAWLPEAYPAAPSHVSALMSGTMINTGLYGLLRVVFDFLGGGVPWWGMLILVLGGISAALGALLATVETDLKRMLAFSSIENMGIMLIGAGAGILFNALGHPELSGLALMGMLYHMLNHSCFKSLLFCGAGSIIYATKTSDLDSLGGLIRRMPRTAALFLFGTIALLALPPLNGFISEWLTLQALLHGVSAGGPMLRLLMPLAAATLAFTGGLAVMAFTKAFAVAFLAKPRSAAAAEAKEVPRSMQVGMGVLAGACAVLALSPSVVLGVLDTVCAPMLQGFHAFPAGTSWLVVRTPLADLSSSGVLALLAILLAFAFVLPFLLGSRLGTRVAPTWGCGIALTPKTQYSAMGFAQPMRAIFGRLLLPHTQEVQAKGWTSTYLKRDMRYAVYLEPLLQRYLYGPIVRGVMWCARQASHLQAGSIHLYLAYILVTLLLVLVFLKSLG